MAGVAAQSKNERTGGNNQKTVYEHNNAEVHLQAPRTFPLSNYDTTSTFQ